MTGVPFISILVGLMSILWLQSPETIPNCWKHIPKSYFGIPFEIVLDGRLDCFASDKRWVSRYWVYHLDERYFTIDNLKHLFGRTESPINEERIIVVSDASIAAWLVEQYVVGEPPEKDSEFQAGLSRLRLSHSGLAQFYKIGEDKVVWYKLPAPNNATASGSFVFEGRDPYRADQISFPYEIVEALLLSDPSGIECGWREFLVSLRPCDFSDANLINLLSWLSAKFPVPVELRVQVNSDRSKLDALRMSRYDTPSIVSSMLRERFPFVHCKEMKTLSNVGGSAHYRRWRSGIECNVYYKGSSEPRKLYMPLQK